MKGLFVSFLSLAAAFSVVAGTASSNEFKLDCRTGHRTAVVPEHIQYSTAWATNLTASQQADAKAVVKVNPCLKTPPKYLVVDMSGGRSAARWPIGYLDEVPEGGWTDEYKTEKLVLRYIPAGSFIMGGRATDYPGAVNTNLHMVTLTKPFYIGVFECTQRQWELAMGTRPSLFTNESCYATRPVECVLPEEINTCLGVLNGKTRSAGFCLPSGEQWECACRAGTTTALNNGCNLISEFNDPNLDLVGRAASTGGRDEYAAVGSMRNLTTEKGTAKVGSLCANRFGLYDMHGNVYELSQDSELVIARGGSWQSAARDCVSSRATISVSPGNMVGFRVCLNVEYLFDLGSVLVNASGADAADWTPTQAGTYQLTHEVQMGGTPVGAMESALFKVEGPELVVEANGELEPGVEIAVKVKGEGEQWNVYYTLDGSEPTEEATLYEGPFALEESATVRAVAISEAGVRSDEARADFTLHDAMSVVGAVARQRYPWNGMVDINCEITGDSNRVYAVEVTATDLDGGTNLPVKTVHMAARPESAPYRLAPGKYRFTWNADADITGDFDFANASVSVAVKGGPLVGYARQMTISTDGYAGSETLTNVPVLVRLSTAIEGFNYNDFASPLNGADMVFMDEAETQVLPYEIDEWHTNGESLVWVKIPELKHGTKFKLAYGGSEHLNHSTSQPLNSAPHEVWREYAGVWHMNEDSGTAFDSTEHGLDALPDCGTNKLADVSQMVAYENGACGRARVNATGEVDGGNHMIVPAYDGLGLADVFSIQGWVSLRDVHYSPRLFSRKDVYSQRGGWDVAFKEASTSNSVMGANNSADVPDHYIEVPSAKNLWVSYAYLFDRDRVCCFTNGAMCGTVSISSATDNGNCLAFGNTPASREHSLCGQYDEIRLRGGTLSADRIKADYDMIANKNFCTYLMVKEGVEE